MTLDKNLKIVMEEWKSKKLFLLKELTDLLNCAEITVKCYLRKWNAISSYNHNSKYYTLPEIAEFDANGLWEYNGIGFSEDGNLIQTIVHLVSLSLNGLYVKDIADLLHLDCTSLISRIFRRKYLTRKRFSGKYIYFSADEDIYKRQLKERRKIIEIQSGTEISDTVAVAILVELINNPRLANDEFVKHLSIKSINITEIQLNSFLEHHGIPKKTSDLQQ